MYKWVGVHNLFCGLLSLCIVIYADLLFSVCIWLFCGVLASLESVCLLYSVCSALTVCQSQTDCSGLAACRAWWCTTGCTAPWGNLHEHTGGRESVRKWQKIKLKQKSLEGGLEFKESTEGSEKGNQNNCSTSTSSVLVLNPQMTLKWCELPDSFINISFCTVFTFVMWLIETHTVYLMESKLSLRY